MERLAGEEREALPFMDFLGWNLKSVDGLERTPK